LDKFILEATTVNQFKNGLQKLKQSRMGFFEDWSPFNSMATSLLQVWCGHTRYITRYILFYMYRVLVRFLALECLQWCLTVSTDLGVRQAVIRPRPKYACKNLFQKKLGHIERIEFKHT